MSAETKNDPMAPADEDLPQASWNEEALQKYIEGEITLADLQGVDAASQTKLAELGYRLLDTGKLADARAIFEGLVALNPKEPYFLLAAGSVAHRQERWQDADHWYSLALERDDHNAVACANRGEVRIMLERMEDAVADLVRALELDAGSKEPTTARARGLLQEINRQLTSPEPTPAEG